MQSLTRNFARLATAQPVLLSKRTVSFAPTIRAFSVLSSVYDKSVSPVHRVTPSSLGPAAGSRTNQRRLGRGKSSGLGGTSTRGHKGQKARSGNGKPKAGFEGGQTPISRRFPKRGFHNHNERTWAPLNLDRLQYWIDQGRLPTDSTPERPITAFHLQNSRCLHGIADGVKILGDGADALTSPVHLVVSRASRSAIQAIEKAGGSVVCRFYNDLALKDCVAGRADRKAANPIRKPDILWYTNSANRGYLSPRVKGDVEGMKAEKAAKTEKSRLLRKTQAKVDYPIMSLEAMVNMPTEVTLPKVKRAS